MKKNGWIVIIVTLIALLLPAAGIQIALHGKTVPLDKGQQKTVMDGTQYTRPALFGRSKSYFTTGRCFSDEERKAHRCGRFRLRAGLCAHRQPFPTVRRARGALP